MATTTITYKGNTIANLGDSGTKTLLTQGKYLEGNVVVNNAKTYTATLKSSGDLSWQYVKYPGSSGPSYYTSGDTFTFSEGDTLYCHAGHPGEGDTTIVINGTSVASHREGVSSNYSYSLPAGDIVVTFGYNGSRSGWSIVYVTAASYEAVEATKSVTLTSSPRTIYPSSGYTAVRQVTVTAQSGTAGTPTATKGTVANNSVTVTPSVTNTTGWITGSTITGTDVTVSAGELVSGTLSIDDDGTYDVTNYASADVAIDYTAKTIPVTFVNHRASLPISVRKSLRNNVIGSSGYIECDLTSSVSSSNSVVKNMPYGFTLCLTSIGTGNFEARIGDTVLTPREEVFDSGLGNSGTYFKYYELAKSDLSTSGTTIDIYDSSDPFKYSVVLDTLSATSNTTYTAPSGTAYNSVTVAVPAPTPSLQSKTATPTESQQSITADSGYDGLSDVTVNAISSTYVGSGIDRRDSTNLTASGATVTVPAGYYENQASKAVSSGSATPAATISGSSATITTSANSITLSKTVSNTPVVSEGYISSGTAGNSDVSLTASVTVNPTPTASGKTVTTPAGYYTTSTTTDVATGSATSAASISGTNATISTGTNTITLSKTVSNTPTVSAGYISSGTAGNSDVSLTASVIVNPTPTASGATVTIPAGYYSAQTTKSVTSGSATGPSSLSGSSATVTTGTNTITLTKTGVTTTPTVSAGYVSSATASTATVSLTASVTTKGAQTYTPGTTDQTIASGTYLTGTQTIIGDADLVASNIKDGVTIFGVTGSYSGGGSYPDGDNMGFGGN